MFVLCSDGGIGRRAGLKILFSLRECGFDSHSEYNMYTNVYTIRNNHQITLHYGNKRH